jgi:hypothetical protein
MTVRRACRNWVIVHPSPSVQSVSDYQNRIKVLGFNNETGNNVMNTHYTVW